MTREEEIRTCTDFANEVDSFIVDEFQTLASWLIYGTEAKGIELPSLPDLGRLLDLMVEGARHRLENHPRVEGLRLREQV